MVANWELVKQGQLPKLFGPDVFNFLSQPPNHQILLWLDDTDSLIRESPNARTIRGQTGPYYDYSYMITPAFKALEYWIILIAPYLGVEQELIDKAKNQGKFNSFLNDESIEKLVKNVSKKLEIKAEKTRQMRQSLEALNAYLKNLRHSPAHCGTVIGTHEKALTYFHEIVGAIDRITQMLMDENVIMPKQ